MSSIRILLADEHAGWCADTRVFLQSEPDLEVIGEAADSEETVRLAQQLRPNILLLVIKMPLLDGSRVARMVHTTLPKMRTLVLTGYDINVRSIQDLLYLGVRGYLSKTVLPGELIRAIRAVHAGQIFLNLTVMPMACATSEYGAKDEPTPRETEVLRLVAQGHKTSIIAQHLNISERTVRFHLTNLFTKLAVSSRTELVHLARRRGWLVL